MKKTFLFAASFSLFIVLAGCTQPQAENNNDPIELTISAAASLNAALSEIEEMYEAENANINLLFNYGGSGSLQQQIIQGAPVDVFFSAAEDKFDQLLDKGLTDQGYITDLIGNELTLIIPEQSKANLNDFTGLVSEMINKIAIGTPETVPAGQYAQQALQNIQVWDKLVEEDKLIPTKDVSQVLSYVETNNVDAGIVYMTDAQLSDKVKIVAVADSNLHDPIVYPVGVIEASKHKEEAIDFFLFLKTDPALAIFKKYGFPILG